MLAVTLGALAGLASADVWRNFEMLFGTEAKKVAITRSTADDAAFAAKLLKAARSLNDAPELQRLLYKKAYTFGLRDPAGHATALESLELWARAAPSEVPDLHAKKLDVLRRHFEASRGQARKVAAKPYLEMLVAHGYNGILDYYNEQFDAADDLISLRLLELLTGKDFPSDNPCPCGNGRILRECHGPALESLRTHQTPEEWHDELLQILKMFQSGERRTTGRYESMELDSGCGVVKTPTAPTKQDGRRPSNGRDPRNFTPLDPPKRPTGASYGAKTAPTADVRRSSLHREAPEIPKQRGLSILELSPAHG